MGMPNIHPSSDAKPITAVIKKPHCDERFKIDSKWSPDFNSLLLVSYAGTKQRIQNKKRDHWAGEYAERLRIALSLSSFITL
jgi:hypothetical protein